MPTPAETRLQSLCPYYIRMLVFCLKKIEVKSKLCCKKSCKWHMYEQKHYRASMTSGDCGLLAAAKVSFFPNSLFSKTNKSVIE